MSAVLRDRVAFALLVPSLAVPVVALALAAWRMLHVDDGRATQHVGLAPIYFGAMMTLAATLFSMSLNTVVAVRNHASLERRTIPLGVVAPHFAVTLIVAVWTVQFCLAIPAMEGFIFGIALAATSLVSLVVIARHRVDQPRFTSTSLGRGWVVVRFGHPVLVVTALALAVYGVANGTDLVTIVAIAALGLLGSPWAGFTGMLWLPLVGLAFLSGSVTAMPVVFLVLAAVPAIANAWLAIAVLGSTERRNRLANDFLEALPGW